MWFRYYNKFLILWHVLMSWQNVWRYDVFLTSWQTVWRRGVFFTLGQTFWHDIFLTSSHTFYIMTYFWLYDKLFTSWHMFDFMTNFGVMTNPLKEWWNVWYHNKLIDIMTCLWHWHFFDMTNCLTSWCMLHLLTAWRTFWRHGTFWQHHTLFDILTHFLTSSLTLVTRFLSSWHHFLCCFFML